MYFVILSSILSLDTVYQKCFLYFLFRGFLLLPRVWLFSSEIRSHMALLDMDFPWNKDASGFG